MLCVVILTPLVYYYVKQGIRVQRTLQFVERYGDCEYAKYALLLDAAIDNQYTALQQLLMDPKLTADELEKKYTRFILQLFEDTELRNAMSQLLRFHEELVQCVINELCDQEITLNFFSNSTGDLLRTYYPFICERRSRWKDPSAYQVIENFYLEQSDSELCKVEI